MLSHSLVTFTPRYIHTCDKHHNQLDFEVQVTVTIYKQTNDQETATYTLAIVNWTYHTEKGATYITIFVLGKDVLFSCFKCTPR